jgi:hypothetical protein
MRHECAPATSDNQEGVEDSRRVDGEGLREAMEEENQVVADGLDHIRNKARLFLSRFCFALTFSFVYIEPIDRNQENGIAHAYLLEILATKA